MAARDLGKILLLISGTVVVVVFAQLVVQIRSYNMGFDLQGIWSHSRGWILLWLFITLVGSALLALKRS